jgi:O-succinylbenzoic acid--CoA ligase
MAWIILKGRNYSIEELRSLTINESQTEFEKSTITFCQSWLNRQSEFVIHTSGSTGRPKEIILLRNAMEASALQTIKALNLISFNTALVCLDTKYIAGQMMLARGLILGMNLIAVEPSANPLDQVEELRIGFAAMVPYQLETILNHTPEKLNRIHCVILGGAAVSNSLKEKIQKTKCAIYATYGMTETISHVALQKLNGSNAQDYFEAFSTIQLRLDERDCLCIKADYLAHETITNDLVELIDTRKFRWLGRKDNIINSGGVKIIPEKVEAVLEKIFDSLRINNRFFVAGLPDEKLGQKLIVAFEGEPLHQSTLDQINSAITPLLNKYEIPKEFKFTTRFAETPTGKINRHSSLTGQ